MPEYLAPGVFIEETSFRSKPIEGVATSTAGIAGCTRTGPVEGVGGPLAYEPRLITGFTEFERMYGSVDALDGDRDNVTAHAARAFFLNGGQRLYVSRVFQVSPADAPVTKVGGLQEPGDGVAWAPVLTADKAKALGHWRARWPGRIGNVTVRVEVVRSRNIAVVGAATPQAKGARDGAVVQVVAAGGVAPRSGEAINSANLRVVRVAADGSQTFDNGAVALTDQLFQLELQVTVTAPPTRVDITTQLGVDPTHRRPIDRILGLDAPEDDAGLVSFVPAASPNQPDTVTLLQMLCTPVGAPDDTPADVGLFTLTGGTDGLPPTADTLRGHEGDPDHANIKATGLTALADVEDIAIVLMPEAATLGSSDEITVATGYLIDHAGAPGAFRVAIVDPPRNCSMNAVREFRGQHDSYNAALYYPWIRILDPTAPPTANAGRPQLSIPPSGFVAGIYARSDIARGVSKAPANEVVSGLTHFELNVNTPRQQVLNPEGINALRFFPGRGSRVWGARTMSSDPEWRYINVVRFFKFVEHSLYNATQWAVFEPNNPQLWSRVKQAVSDFLEVQWRDGALLGNTRNEAFFVRCDRTTMTQNDLDNGRMVCLVGMSPVRPAEFVIFRIGQFTADSQ